MTKKLIYFMTILPLILTATCWAQKKVELTKIGTVALLKGKVVRQQNQVEEELKLSAAVYEGDTIVTSKNSYIKILLVDDTIFDFGPQTKFELEKLKMNKNPEDRKASFDFVYGKMRSLFINKAKEGNIQIKTPNVSMGVRGTEILSNVQTVNSVTSTEVALLSGSVSLDVSSSTQNSATTSLTLVAGTVFNSDRFSQTQNVTQAVTQLTNIQINNLTNTNPATLRPTFLDEIVQDRPTNQNSGSPSEQGSPSRMENRNNENRQQESGETMPVNRNNQERGGEMKPGQSGALHNNTMRLNERPDKLQHIGPNQGLGHGHNLFQMGRPTQYLQQMQNQQAINPNMGSTTQNPLAQPTPICYPPPNYQPCPAGSTYCTPWQPPPGC